MLSKESFGSGLPHTFCSNACSSPSMRFCSFFMAESVGQYCASVLPSMLVVLYILPLYMFFVKKSSMDIVAALLRLEVIMVCLVRNGARSSYFTQKSG